MKFNALKSRFLGNPLCCVGVGVDVFDGVVAVNIINDEEEGVVGA